MNVNVMTYVGLPSLSVGLQCTGDAVSRVGREQPARSLGLMAYVQIVVVF